MRLLGGSLLLGLSAATFFTTPVAEQLLRLTPARLYFVRSAPERLDYWLLLGLIFLMGIATGTAFWASYGRSGFVRRLLEAPLAFLLAMGVEHLIYLHLCRYPPLYNGVASVLVDIGLPAVDGWFLLALVCGLVVVWVFGQWPWGWMLVKPVLCGVAAVIWLICAIALVRPVGTLPERVFAGAAAVHQVHEIGPGSPIVWVVLDEWDYDRTYRREDHKIFPEFERLRNQSVFLENVRAAGRITLVAIPGLLMGRTVRDYRTAGPSGARFVSVGASESFPGPNTIFDAAAQFGYQSHIVGWYHPYCRMFATQVASCWWDDLILPSLRPGEPAANRAGALLRDSIEFEILPFVGATSNFVKQMARVGPMVERAGVAASHPGRNFSFLHLPVPHSPFFQMDATGALSPLRSDVNGYQSGLDAADRAVGSLRQTMESAGVWEEALVIVTSDHPYRYQLAGGYGNGHIPMMIKFPHQNSALTYSHPFEAVETKNLIEDFMQGAVATPDRAVAWLEHSAPVAGAKAVERPPMVNVRGSP